MSTPVVIAGNPFNLTATGNVGVALQDMTLIGFYVNNTTAGTMVLRRGGSGGTVISGTITPAIGWHFFPAICPAGLHLTVGGAIDVTFCAIPGQA